MGILLYTNQFVYYNYRLERGWSSFNYLAGSETFSLSEVDDGEAFRETMDAMAIVGLTEMVCYLPGCPVVLHVHVSPRL